MTETLSPQLCYFCQHKNISVKGLHVEGRICLCAILGIACPKIYGTISVAFIREIIE